MRNVLIISNPTDGHIATVMTKLEASGVQAILFCPEEAGDKVHIAWSFPNEISKIASQFSIGLTAYELERVFSVWYRRPRTPNLGVFSLGSEEKEFAGKEWKAAFDGLYAAMRNALWVSHPDRLSEAAHKPLQLKIAHEVGFILPRTIITNQPALAWQFIEECAGKVIVKPVGPGWVYSQNGEAITYILTNRLSKADVDALAMICTAPVVFQEEIAKAYEVRVNVVGSEALAIKIDSQRSPISSLDWRRYDTAHTPYTAYQLPQDIVRRCLKLTQLLGLEFSAIDLIRRPDGAYVFLEINGNGQFLWAEELSGVPVSDALARLLSGTMLPLKAVNLL